jgi:FtsP/CotA-like multicopper oxidase with cupredoxin domain
MSRNQRIALVVAALAVAVLAFVIAQPGDDDDSADRESTAPASQTEPETTTDTTTDAEPPPPQVTRIRMENGSVVGGAKDIEVTRGDTVRIVVSSNTPDDIHLHGYDIERQVAPGKPGRFRFKANAEGAFEIESHVAEDGGRDPLVARLVVQPS